MCSGTDGCTLVSVVFMCWVLSVSCGHRRTVRVVLHRLGHASPRCCQEVRRAHGSVADGHFRACGFVLDSCCVHVVFFCVLLYRCVCVGYSWSMCILVYQYSILVYQSSVSSVGNTHVRLSYLTENNRIQQEPTRTTTGKQQAHQQHRMKTYVIARYSHD